MSTYNNGVTLYPLTEKNRQLYVDIYCSEDMMKNLGGKMSLEEANIAFDKSLIQKNNYHATFAIWSSQLQVFVGTVGFWQTEIEERSYMEVGWMILPKFQRQGFASMAAREIVNKVKELKPERPIVAFAEKNNPASDKICKKLGFRFVKPAIQTYGVRVISCHQWVLE